MSRPPTPPAPSVSIDDVEAAMAQASPIRRRPTEPVPTAGEVSVVSVAATTETATAESDTTARPVNLGRQYVPFPVAALPPPLCTLVTEAAASLRVDAGMLGAPMLAVLAAAIGNSRRLLVKPDWTEPAVVWVAVVTESGSAKTPSLWAVAAPLREWQARALKAHAKVWAEHEAAELCWQRDVAAFKKGAAGGDPPAKPTPPTAERVLIDDATLEATVSLLAANPRGMLLLKDELDGWVSSMDAYRAGRGGDASRWLEMANAGPVTVDRKGGGVQFVPRAAVSLTGCVQPDVVRETFTSKHRSSGLCARMLWAFPPFKVRKFSRETVDPFTRNLYGAVVSGLLALPMGTDDEGEPCPVNVPLAADALDLYVRWHDEHADAIGAASGDLRAAMVKLTAYALRFALILHLAKVAAGLPGCSEAEVDADSMERALTLTRWFLSETERVVDLMSETEVETEDRKLIRWLEGRPSGCTASELARAIRRYRNNAEAAEFDLARLEAAGLGKWVPVPSTAKGGRPTERFVLHSVYATETPETPPTGA